jgi:hypothetical protein
MKRVGGWDVDEDGEVGQLYRLVSSAILGLFLLLLPETPHFCAVPAPRFRFPRQDLKNEVVGLTSQARDAGGI